MNDSYCRDCASKSHSFSYFAISTCHPTKPSTCEVWEGQGYFSTHLVTDFILRYN